ncbi:vanadium-dependent haloperoxidase [Pelotomaculum propionicicum]|uniref:vanadium-dependent haloperoxidase n=1 Tax=Pelotomaculum propionicicum TaxID=258475 RepID=UPI003B7D3DC5
MVDNLLPDKNNSVSLDGRAKLKLKHRVSCLIGPLKGRERLQKAYRIRLEAARFQRDLPLTRHKCNGDENLYPNKIGSFSKALPHDNLGEVSLSAYYSLIRALSSGDPEEFESIPLGGPAKLVNPQAAYAYELAGPDSHHLSMPPAPALSSAETAGEMAECYWQALARDVPFTEYETDPLTVAAASDLSGFSVFRGPKECGAVTPGTLFRGDTPGDLEGPYISQFLWQDIPFGARTVTQRYHAAAAGADYMTSYKGWLKIQNGLAPSSQNVYSTVPRYICNGRDMCEWVHKDFSFQGPLAACLILLGYGPEALAQSNPYLRSATQFGFPTFGSAHILDFTAHAVRAALEAAWFQKWLVHRRLRPEEFGGLVEKQMTGRASYPINSELLNSQVLSEVYSRYGSYLLPQAYPEGCPAHPSYPSGHATYTGAGVTMLKAFFKESFIIPNPVVSSYDGLSMLPYTGPPLTVGGELNKLAANVALSRDFAGIHWRSDGIEGIKLGEAVAIGILRDYRNAFNEDFAGFSFTRFDGSKIAI